VTVYSSCLARPARWPSMRPPRSAHLHRARSARRGM